MVWPNYFEDCEQCVERLREILEELDGLQKVEISPERRSLHITYNTDLVTFEDIQDHARLAGVTLAERYNHEVIQVVGLDCPDCASKLETGIRRLNGVVWASLSYATSVLIVEYEPKATSIEKIKRRVFEFGYEIQEPELAGATPTKTKNIRSARSALTVTSGILLGIGLLMQYVLKSPVIAGWLYIASAVTGGIFAARTGFLSLKALALDTNFLMTAAAIGAVWLGDYSEAAAVMFLFSLGSTLEAHTVEKTRKSLKSLIDGVPTRAIIRRDGSIIECPVAEIEIGDVVIIKPGDKIPVDGTITAGESAINEAPITGESIPREKNQGDSVFAGSINGRGALEVRSTTTFEDNTLSRIIHLVEEAHAQRAPSQQFTEKFGRYYTPTVIGLALAVAVLGPLLSGQAYQLWLTRALTLLVVSCPCALVISTPVAIVAAIGNAAKSGVLIKGVAHLEALGDVSVIAFDKTGTLTQGRPIVTGIVSLSDRSEEEIISAAAGVESRSEHPLADAIIEKAREMNARELQIAFFEAFPGKGARAVADGGVFFLGSSKYMEEIGHKVPDNDAIRDLLAGGNTVVFLADENGLWGAIGAKDAPKAQCMDAITHLRSTGIKKTILLTGDTYLTAVAIAGEMGIDESHADLLPEDKLAKIREYVEKREVIAMVGDGINDAPALAAADVGIAMGGAGSYAAVEAADVALMADDISMLPYALTLSRRAKRIIMQNVAFALIVVIALITGALISKVNLATGVLGHEGSALLVIANSMRLLKK